MGHVRATRGKGENRVRMTRGQVKNPKLHAKLNSSKKSESLARGFNFIHAIFLRAGIDIAP